MLGVVVIEFANRLLSAVFPAALLCTEEGVAEKPVNEKAGLFAPVVASPLRLEMTTVSPTAVRPLMKVSRVRPMRSLLEFIIPYSRPADVS
jgi:hypothetical protein